MDKNKDLNNSVFEISIKFKMKKYAIRVESNGAILMAIFIFLLKMLPILIKIWNSS